jgi:hypothetical protein
LAQCRVAQAKLDLAPLSASLVLGRRVRARRIDRDAIAGGYNRNVGLDRLGGGDIGVAAGGVAFLQFRHAATVERGGIGRIEPDRLGVVGDGAVEVALACQAMPRL